MIQWETPKIDRHRVPHWTKIEVGSHSFAVDIYAYENGWAVGICQHQTGKDQCKRIYEENYSTTKCPPWNHPEVCAYIDEHSIFRCLALCAELPTRKWNTLSQLGNCQTIPCFVLLWPNSVQAAIPCALPQSTITW